MPVSIPWVDQPASPGAMRGELQWNGSPGSAGAISSALASWNLVRFEVTEDASPGCDAVRYSSTPALGTFCAVIAANGDIVIPENRLRAAMALAASAKSANSRADGDPADSLDLRESRGLRDLRDRHGPRHPALGGSLEDELRLLLGEAWDAELEPFRRAGDGAPVRWLNATG